ncbi:hypothetical protein LSCM1_01761 [Leishmania martiniquensis]|uniref:Uncharacterized protein n=1 Tax=Leishmania martiniquensis TaxID=1580590 RepID=A0A836FWC2_9TRYP|nr:hypothetical protein LSCM1_01761 [Leishmania martiniquensis]
MTSFTEANEGRARVSWSLQIQDAGTPPTMVATSLWLSLSFCVAVLFVELRPAAIRHLRTSADHNARAIKKDANQSPHSRWLWRLLAAVWTCALYDVVHRTFCYCILSAHMLARRRLLPLGNDFFWDGLWTEWVNSVRLYVFCTPFASTSAPASFGSCAGWQLPIAGTLAYERYPEYAALNVSQLATSSEVMLYRRVCLASLAITWISVIVLHGQFALMRRALSRVMPPSSARSPNDLAEEPSRAERDRPLGINNLPMALDATEAPGDDSWLDSPEALAEEARWQLYDEQPGPSHGGARRLSAPSHVRVSFTSQILKQCWPSLASAVYAALYAFVGGMPLLMHLVFPTAVSVVSAMMMIVTV